MTKKEAAQLAVYAQKGLMTWEEACKALLRYKDEVDLKRMKQRITITDFIANGWEDELGKEEKYDKGEEVAEEEIQPGAWCTKCGETLQGDGGPSLCGNCA